MVASCLFVIDVQKGFINDHTRHLPERIEALQATFGHVLATRFLNPEGSFHRGLIHWDRFAPGSEEAELAIVPKDGAVRIDKTTYTCLVPEVRAWLVKNKITKVFLCGIATDNCVLKTAVDLFEEKIIPVILSDCCGSHGGPDCHAAGLLLARRFIGTGQVITSDQAFREIKLPD